MTVYKPIYSVKFFEGPPCCCDDECEKINDEVQQPPIGIQLSFFESKEGYPIGLCASKRCGTVTV